MREGGGGRKTKDEGNNIASNNAYRIWICSTRCSSAAVSSPL